MDAKVDEVVIRISELTNSHSATVALCNMIINAFRNNENSYLIFDFTESQFIYLDHAVLLLCTVKLLESKGIRVRGHFSNFNDSKAFDYLNKMNFFSYFNLTENISKPAKNLKSSILIKTFTKDNDFLILREIVDLIKKQSDMDEDVFVALDYCFGEILDNVTNHSETDAGWVAAQYFPNLNKIRLIVCDIGIGIQSALNIRYNYSNQEALENCIIKNITNGKGQGHGLFAASEFIKLNKGLLSIISGNGCLLHNCDNSIVENIEHWQGTCVYLEVNTNIKVDYKKFTSEKYDQKKVLYESLFK